MTPVFLVRIVSFIFFTEPPFSKIVNTRKPSLCGTHALERVGKIKSQTIQNGGFFYSEDEKGVFGKKGGARVGFRSYFTKL